MYRYICNPVVFMMSILSLMLVRTPLAHAQITFTEYPGPTTPTFESGYTMVDITTGPDGNLWFTENYGNIGRITSAGVITEFTIPSPSSCGGITTGPDGNIWFLDSGANKIVKASGISANPIVVSKLTVIPGTVIGSLYATGTVTLSASVAIPQRITLTNTNPAAVVPAYVTIPAGASSASFTITTTAVTTTQKGTITASYNGSGKSAKLTVRPIGIHALYIVPSLVMSGYDAIGVVTLEARAAPGPITVTLISSNPAVAQPVDSSGSPLSSFTIPAGTSSAAFYINTGAVSANTVVTLSATANGITKTAKLTVTP